MGKAQNACISRMKLPNRPWANFDAFADYAGNDHGADFNLPKYTTKV
jgi:hypothetical protein